MNLYNFFNEFGHLFQETKKMNDFLSLKQRELDPEEFEMELDEYSTYLDIAFRKEYDEAIRNEEYFFGCEFRVYKNSYPSIFKSFQEKYPEGNEFGFIENEFKKGILNFPIREYMFT